jgi:RHS repeat-associated protein
MPMSVVYTTFAGAVVREDRGGTVRDYGRDTLGSTAALYDESGNKTDEWEYWPYGEVRSHAGTSTTPFTFVGTLGYFMDAATRYYVRARSYRADLGRWTTVDPLWPDESAYGYVGGMPTMVVDPSGKASVPPVYGNYCGPQSGKYSYPPTDPTRPAPIDPLDACCQRHDDCFFHNGCNVCNQIVKAACRMCNRDLCYCAASVVCKTSACWIMRKVAMAYACNLM